MYLSPVSFFADRDRYDLFDALFVGGLLGFVFFAYFEGGLKPAALLCTLLGASWMVGHKMAYVRMRRNRERAEKPR